LERTRSTMSFLSSSDQHLARMGLSGRRKMTHNPQMKEKQPYVMNIACQDRIEALPGFAEKLGCLMLVKAYARRPPTICCMPSVGKD